MQYPSGNDKEYFFQVLERYNAGAASPEEQTFVESYMEMLERRAPVEEQEFELQKNRIANEIRDQLFSSIRQLPAPPPVAKVRVLRRRNLWAAASVALLLAAGGAGVYYYNRTETPLVQNHYDVQPGKAGAILTLANGSQLVLDSLGNGVVVAQAGSTVAIQNGALQYNNDRNDANGGIVSYNTLSTPKGRQYQVILPDGSKVWLNAASSLTYPVAFHGKERNVKVTGEAYFEIAKNERQPFMVSINNTTTVQVLGTSFNVNAYANEPAINTTLVQGAVKVVTKGAEQVLQPGQQASITPRGNTITLVKNADIAQVVAWKDGSFAFNKAKLDVVMRQLARWYDIEVVYEGTVTDDTFSGEIDKSLTLAQVLKGLTQSRINYSIEDGNKLVIRP